MYKNFLMTVIMATALFSGNAFAGFKAPQQCKDAQGFERCCAKQQCELFLPRLLNCLMDSCGVKNCKW